MDLKISFSLIFCSILTVLHVVSARNCFNGFFKPNSTYDSNRRLALSSLASNVKIQNGFYNSSVGQNPGRIFVMGMCIPGTKQETCSDCIKEASDSLLQSCPNRTDAFTWLDYCMVRYSNESFAGSYIVGPAQVMYNNDGDITYNATLFAKIWEELMDRTITPVRDHGHKYYAVGVAPLSDNRSIYTMMQCTPELTPGYCGLCFRFTLESYESSFLDRQGCSVTHSACFVRWDSRPFAGAFENVTMSPPQRESLPPPQLSLTPPQLSLTPPVGHRANTTSKDGKAISIGTIVAIVVPTDVILVLLVVGFAVCRRRKHYQTLKAQVGEEITSVHSLQFTFSTIVTSTDNFSDKNMIGRGGFGQVYKGKLLSGTEVAVKRLSKTSGQGAQEFKNEAVLLTKLQHRNLVRLLGFCSEGGEKILVYEFVPNKSLDYFLFDPTKQAELDWSRRYNIIRGIARGILYLHQDSRPTIIHRDLKVSNILLDADMNPKIADFGMARTFVVDQSKDNTRKIVGTHGYMSPEYAMRGHFSMKSDVYSFGVIILEIISGKKNSSFYQVDDSTSNLVTHAWRLWSNESHIKLVDSTIEESYMSDEATRCIHIALLCVQDNPADRPMLSEIILMLTCSTMALPVPRSPGFCLSSMSDTTSISMSISRSIDDVSITNTDPR